MASPFLQATPFTNRSLAASFVGPWIDCRGVSAVSIELANPSTGSPAGAWSIQETNDPVVESEKWAGTASSGAASVDTTDSARVLVEGTGLAVAGANTTLLQVALPAKYVRVSYTRSSGTGTASCYVHGRSVGSVQIATGGGGGLGSSDSEAALVLSPATFLPITPRDPMGYVGFTVLQVNEAQDALVWELPPPSTQLWGVTAAPADIRIDVDALVPAANGSGRALCIHTPDAGVTYNATWDQVAVAADIPAFGTTAGTACQGNDSRLVDRTSRYFLATAHVSASTTLVDVTTWNVALASLASGRTYLLEFEGAVSSGLTAAVGLAFIFGSTSSLIQGQGWLGGAAGVFTATENTTGSFSLTKNGSATPVHLSCLITTTSAGTLKLQASIATGTLTIRAGSWFRVTALT